MDGNDTASTVLHIQGKNFSASPPTLTLGSATKPLVVMQATGTQVDALLPVGIQPGG